MMKEPGNTFVMAISAFVTFFLSTFGISDFAISTVLYRAQKWVSDKKLPGTLNAQSALPVAVMALSYITSINVEIKTLLVCIVAQILGAYIGPRFVVKLNATVIRRVIGVGLIIAASLIVAGKFGLIGHPL